MTAVDHGGLMTIPGPQSIGGCPTQFAGAQRSARARRDEAKGLHRRNDPGNSAAGDHGVGNLHVRGACNRRTEPSGWKSTINCAVAVLRRVLPVHARPVRTVLAPRARVQRVDDTVASVNVILQRAGVKQKRPHQCQLQIAVSWERLTSTSQPIHDRREWLASGSRTRRLRSSIGIAYCAQATFHFVVSRTSARLVRLDLSTVDAVLGPV